MNNGKRSLQSENPDVNRNTKKRRKNVTTLEDVRHGFMSLNPNSTPLGEITNSTYSQSKDARTHRLEIRRMKKSCGKVVKRPDVTAPSTLNPISTRIDSQSSIILNPQSQAEGSSLGNNDATPQTTTLGSTGFQSQTSQNHDPHSHVKGSSVGKKGDVPSQSYANPISTALHSQTSQILNPHSQVKEANIQVNSTPQTSIPPKKRADGETRNCKIGGSFVKSSDVRSNSIANSISTGKQCQTKKLLHRRSQVKANILVNSTEHISYPPKKMAKSTDTAQVDSDESDSGSELWDCTSSDDDDNQSDSDTFEDDHAKRIERQARINMVFGCLTNKDSPVVDVPVVSRAKEEVGILKKSKIREDLVEAIMNMLRISNGVTIQGTIRDAFPKSFETIMNEGEWFGITNFKLEHSFGRVRMTKNRYNVILSEKSIIFKSEPTTYCNYYAFKPFGSIIRGLAHPMYCIDLYGALVGVGSLETYVLQGDGVGDNSLDNKLVFSLINPEFMTNLEGCSKIMFNPSIPEIEAFKKKIPAIAF
ncbi:hypothetical protein HID58_066684 [Brassica napus]|uniref:Replication protein A 70 kDa DNA-binding subunit B/D first OB fold domain-containing protein n=1 Tax=Brassica napus TaxID=3708 RepID=A0ABQ7ZGD9_BRANA|nr:hypothetical protein HID58_066684 [Brassica napus]